MLPKIAYLLTEITIPTTKQVVKVRPFLVKEEKLLLMAKTSASKTDMLNAIKQVVNNCLQTEGVDVEKLSIVDLEYLFLKLRAASVNNVVKVSYRDHEDDKVYDFEVDLDKVEVRGEVADRMIPVKDGISLVMKYPSASAYLDEKLLKEDQELEFLIGTTLEEIVNGVEVHKVADVSPEELREFIEQLPVPVFDKIKEFWASIPHLYYEIKYTNSVGSERTIPLSTLEDFFTFF